MGLDGSYRFSTCTQKQDSFDSALYSLVKQEEIGSQSGFIFCSTKRKFDFSVFGIICLGTYIKSPFRTGVLQLFHLPKKQG